MSLVCALCQAGFSCFPHNMFQLTALFKLLVKPNCISGYPLHLIMNVNRGLLLHDATQP